MDNKNIHGLSRHIPSNIKRQVRQNSKFGCVICRKGFYQYEHILPEFKDAKEHDAAKICCLCSSCHTEVTCGRFSKDMVASKYLEIKSKDNTDMLPPSGPLDFHRGNSELFIGGLNFNPLVHNILRYYGENLIRLIPGKDGMPGMISAEFSDDDGNIVLQLDKNQWIGSLTNWDIEITATEFTIRKKMRDISLKLRLNPPGQIIIEQLDMRIRDIHIIANQYTYAIGRYFTDGTIYWVSAPTKINKASKSACIFDVISPEQAEKVIKRGIKANKVVMQTSNQVAMLIKGSGFIAKHAGIIIANNCDEFMFSSLIIGPQPIEDIRKYVKNYTKTELIGFNI